MSTHFPKHFTAFLGVGAVFGSEYLLSAAKTTLFFLIVEYVILLFTRGLMLFLFWYDRRITADCNAF